MGPPPRLSSLAHGGGCGCKIAPAALGEMLANMPSTTGFANLLVGTETADDAAVWRLNSEQALVATTDFFMPMVDDPYQFGRIAAANALSDIYAMGGRPIMALAIVGMPVNLLGAEVISRILEGGASICSQAGLPIAGGHSIDSVEPIYGLAVIGLVHPDRVLTNRAVRQGDRLVLTKALGVGVLSAAFKKDRLSADGYQALVDSATRLNSVGPTLAATAGVHAMTDVTGFGLLGHALEMARGSKVDVTIDPVAPAWLPQAIELAKAGLVTGASGRNWSSYGGEVDLPEHFPIWRRDLLTDPQTSGGLLIAVAPGEVESVLELLRSEGFLEARIVGEAVPGQGRVRLCQNGAART